MTPKRFGIFLGVNIVISLAVTLGVLWIWQSLNGPIGGGPGAGTPTATRVAMNTATAATPAPTQGSGPVHYTVQAGDTLSSIAARYNVSVQDIMTANGLSNANLISPGQQLIIPVGGLPTEAPTATVPAVPPTPIATFTAQPPGVPVLKIAAVTAPGELANEAVLITNDGGNVRLDGWTLTDGKSNTYTFPSVSLFGGGAVTVHTGRGDNKAADLYWGQTAPVWIHGSTVLLKDASGGVEASYTVP